MFLLLSVVIISTHWATVHTHTTEKHSHDGEHHQHQLKAHVHSLLEQTGTADFSHQLHHTNTVEFANDYCLSKSEIQKTPFIFIVSTTEKLLPTLLLTNNRIPIFEHSRSGYLDRSSLNPRAPPKASLI